MRAAGERLQPLAGLPLVASLTQQPTVQDHLGVDPQYQIALTRRRLHPGDCLPPCVLDHRRLGLATGQLLDLRHHCLERDPERRQDLAPARRGGGEDQASPGNQSWISRSADSSESEPWTRLNVTSRAKSPRMDPGAASSGLVAPMTWRAAVVASRPSRTAATSGPPVMKSNSSPKKGLSVCSS